MLQFLKYVAFSCFISLKNIFVLVEQNKKFKDPLVTYHKQSSLFSDML